MVWTEVFVSTHLHRQHNPCVNTILARKDLGHRAQSTAHIWVDSLCYQQACHGCSNIMKGGYPWYLQCKTPTTKMVLLLPFAFDSLQIGSKSDCISDFWFGNMVSVWGGQVPTSDTDYLATNWIVSNRTKSGWNFKISFMGRVKPKPEWFSVSESARCMEWRDSYWDGCVHGVMLVAVVTPSLRQNRY